MSRVSGEHGSVTAELAIALPAVALVLGLCLSGLQVAGQQIRLQDVAALAARSIARGDGAASVVGRLMPGATVDRSSDGDLVCAILSVRSGGPVVPLAGLTLTATSCALAGGR